MKHEIKVTVVVLSDITNPHQSVGLLEKYPTDEEKAKIAEELGGVLDVDFSDEVPGKDRIVSFVETTVGRQR